MSQTWDTLFKIMEAIVEETTPIINWPNSIRTPLSDKPWWEQNHLYV